MAIKDNTFDEPVIEEKEALPVVEKKEESKPVEKNYYRSKTKEYTEVRIDDLVDTMYNIKFTGEIFKIDERATVAMLQLVEMRGLK